MPTQATRIIKNCTTGEETIETYEIPDPTPEEISAQQAAEALRVKKELESDLERHIDAVAQSYTWKNITSAIAAAGSVNPFQTNAIALKDWWAACWMKAHQIQDEVVEGTRTTVPTKDEFIALMPEAP